MWIKFTGDFSFKPHDMMTRDYKAGQIKNVTTECGEQALAKGFGIRMKKTNKSETPFEVAMTQGEDVFRGRRRRKAADE